MTKILIVVSLLIFLLYILSKKMKNVFSNDGPQGLIVQNGFQKIGSSNHIIAATSQKVMLNIGIGGLLLVIMLALVIKVKILLFLLPVALYLMSFILLFNNHLKVVKGQHIWFNKTTHILRVSRVGKADIELDVLQDVLSVQQIESVQNTKGLLFGYFQLNTAGDKIIIPYLIYQNQPNNKLFFDFLNSHFTIPVEKKLFPRI